MRRLAPNAQVSLYIHFVLSSSKVVTQLPKLNLDFQWAHRITRHGAANVTPFELVCGHEVVLLLEVNLDV